MASTGAFRSPGFVFVFDGQSLNNLPAAPNNYPSVVAGDLSTPSPCPNLAVNGMTVNALNASALNRWAPYLATSATLILVMSTGTSDIWSGDTGATVYADEVAYAALAKANGFDLVYGMTLVGNTTNTAPQNTARTDHNDFLLADASNAFDGVADLAGNATLADWTNVTYYADGLHWTAAGAQLAASIILPVLETAFP